MGVNTSVAHIQNVDNETAFSSVAYETYRMLIIILTVIYKSVVEWAKKILGLDCRQ